jgi:allophanate hydrolase subunit 2
VSAGQSVAVGATSGSRGPIYVGVAGLRVEPVLGSASTDTLSHLGPAPLAAGETATTDPELAGRPSVGRFVRAEDSFAAQVIRAVPGPHLSLMPSGFVVTAVSRSGVRLRPEVVTSEDAPAAAIANLASIPVRPGVIQMTPSGEVIILGPDSGVTGGYPVMGVIPDADLHLMARLLEGDQVRFPAIESSDAAQLDRAAAELTPVVHDLGRATHLG